MGDLKPMEEKVDRTKMPEGKKEIEFSFKNLENFKLSNGINVYYYNYEKIPESILLCSFSAGSVYDDGLDGISNILSQMLLRGSKDKSGEEIEKELKKLGAELDSYSTSDNLNIKLSILQENFDDGLKILKEIIEAPAFKVEELENLRNEVLARLIRQKDSLPSIATFGILKNLYKEHPYNHHWLGEIEKIKNLKIEDIKKFYNSFVNPALLNLIYIGPLKVEELKSKLEIFEKWKKEKPTFKLVAKPENLKEMEVIFIDKPKSAQSLITVSFLSPSPQDINYPAFQIGNHLFGGYFLSRLNMKLREEKGFTYGARSSILPLKFGGYWNFRVPVDSRFTKEALKEILNEIKAIYGEKPIEKGEFEKAKNNLIMGLPSRFESPDNLLSSIETIATFGLPLNYLNEFPEKLKNVKLEEVQNVMDKYFKEGKFLILIVGDKEKIFEEILKEFNFKKINFCDPFGNPLKD